MIGYISTVFTHDKNDDLLFIGESPFPNIPPVKLDSVGINKILRDLDPSKATDPDKLPARYLKLVNCQ